MTSPTDRKVSVIIPICNTEQHLPRCLSSVLGQTHRDLQVLLIDDGSTDRSLEICREFEGSDPRVRVIHQENYGVSSARNAGLDVATGDYVSLVDSDDWLEPSLYEEVLAEMDTHSADAAIFEYFVDTQLRSVPHHESGADYGVLKRAEAIELTIASQNSFAWSRVFTRDLVGATRFRTDLHWGEETLFVCEVLDRAAIVCHLDRPLYHYVQSPGSATRTGFGPRRLSGIDTGLALIAFAEDRYPELAVHAQSFYGGILAQLLVELWSDPLAWSRHGEDTKARLWSLLKGTYASPKIILKRKISWLVAVVSTPLLVSWRTRGHHLASTWFRGFRGFRRVRDHVDD